MSLAWGSIVILLLLLPGVLFFVGLYMSEKFTRETVDKSALGQLAAVMLVSCIVHFALYTVTVVGHRTWGWPAVSVRLLLETITLGESDKDPGVITRVAVMLTQYAFPIMAYISSSALTGVFFGWIFGRYIAQRIGGLAPHAWVFDLKVSKNYTVAWILTHIREEDRILLYHGFLKSFALKKDGTFAYIVLTEASRGYMVLEAECPVTRHSDTWRKIGAAPGSQAHRQRIAPGGRHAGSYLVVEGEDIANAVFDRYDLGKMQYGEKEFEHLVESVVRRLEEEATVAEKGKDSPRRPVQKPRQHRPRGQ